MRRDVVVLLLLVGCDREADQREHCTRFAARLAPASVDAWIEQCVKDRWSAKQMDCHARQGGFQAMFCDE